MRPIIGISCQANYEDPASGLVRHVLNCSYVEAVLRAGGSPVIVPSSPDPEALRPLYTTLAGLLLSGGGDIEPGLYRQPVEAQLISPDPDRDGAELLLARWAIEDGLPVLAICRGIQVLNVALGGALIQDIPSQVPGALRHQQAPRPRPEPQHTVALVPGSRLAGILGESQVEVNSFHHQAPLDVPPGLSVVARAPDGIIEGLERPGPAFVLGVQWHPEEMAAGDPRQHGLFAAFVAACAGRC